MITFIPYFKFLNNLKPQNYDNTCNRDNNYYYWFCCRKI
jgi:hypothetical protein